MKKATSLCLCAALGAPTIGHAENARSTGAAPANLAPRLREQVADLAPLLQVLPLDGFDDATILRTDVAGADRLAAWVLVGHDRVLVRVAGAGRTRFVFRDLPASGALTELDCERIGQALQIALITLAEGGPTLDRARAQEAASTKPPEAPPPALPARPPAPAPELGRTLPTVVNAAAPEQAPLAWTLGALYEAQRAGSGTLHGPGVVFAAGWPASRLRSELFLAGQFDLPMIARSGWFRTEVEGASLRFGASVSPTPWVHAGLAVGLDRTRVEFTSVRDVASVLGVPESDIQVTPPENHLLGVGRVFLRGGPLEVGRYDLSAVVMLELAHRSVDQTLTVNGDSLVVYHDGPLRSGVAAELRWR